MATRKHPLDTRMRQLLRQGAAQTRLRYGLGGVRKGRHIVKPPMRITLPTLTCLREPPKETER